MEKVSVVAMERDDTPEINGATLICLPQREDYFVATGCFGNLRRMNKNSADNIPDDCAAMFTLGQRRKMHANLGVSDRDDI